MPEVCRVFAHTHTHTHTHLQVPTHTHTHTHTHSHKHTCLQCTEQVFKTPEVCRVYTGSFNSNAPIRTVSVCNMFSPRDVDI